MTLNDLVHELVIEGIRITMEYRPDLGVIIYDLNTGMKSHAWLYQKDDDIRMAMRYDRDVVIESYSDVIAEVRGCMCGRDYLSSDWSKVLFP
jgi:hypothetical protein